MNNNIQRYNIQLQLQYKKEPQNNNKVRTTITKKNPQNKKKLLGNIKVLNLLTKYISKKIDQKLIPNCHVL